MALLKYVGGKNASAAHIVSLLPPPNACKQFVDLCVGAGNILLSKPVYPGQAEVINDLDGNLIAFWMTMRDQAGELQARLDGLPYSRALYYEYYRSLFDHSQLSQLERAVRYFYCLRSSSTGWMRKSPTGWNYLDRNMRAYYSAQELFEVVSARLKYVVIDNRDVRDTFKRYDAPDTCFYADFPYFGREAYYETSKYGFPHREMAALFQNARGYVAISYYPDPLIDELYPADRWYRSTWQQRKHSDVRTGATPALATELLLTNYKPPVAEQKQCGLWATMEEKGVVA